MLLSERAGEAGALVGRALDNALKGWRAASLTQRLLAFAAASRCAARPLTSMSRLLDMHDMLQRALGELVQLEIHSAGTSGAWRSTSANWRPRTEPGGQRPRCDAAWRAAGDEVDNSHLDHDYAALFPDATPGEYVMLRVRDNGHGMDAATLARSSNPSSPPSRLAVAPAWACRWCMGSSSSGGHVLIDSVEGGGTSITMMFPRSLLPLPSGRTPQTGLAGYSPREAILVTEDNDDVRAHGGCTAAAGLPGIGSPRRPFRTAAAGTPGYQGGPAVLGRGDARHVGLGAGAGSP